MVAYKKEVPFDNYHGTVSLTPRRTYAPETLDELVEIVREAESKSRHVRAIGSGWSFTTVNLTEDYLVKTDKLNRTLSETMSGTVFGDPVFRSLLPSVMSTFTNCAGPLPPQGPGLPVVKRGGLYHVEAGIKIRELYCRLEAIPCGGSSHGFALPTLGGAAGQSLAGAISTSTHGGDKFLPPLPDMVRGIHLVTSGGAQFFFQKESQRIVDVAKLSALAPGLDMCRNIVTSDAAFNAVLVSMGRMGIIFSMVIEVREQYFLEEKIEEYSWKEVKAQVDDWRKSKSGKYLQITVCPYPDVSLDTLGAAAGSLVDPIGTALGDIGAGEVGNKAGFKCFVATRREVPFAASSPCPPKGEGGFFNWICRQDPELQEFLYHLVTGNPLAVHDVVGPCGVVWDWLLGPVVSGALCHFSEILTFGFVKSEKPQTIGDMVGHALTLLEEGGPAAAPLAGTIINTITEANLPGGKTGISYEVMDVWNYEAKCYQGFSIEVAFDANEHKYFDFMDWLHQKLWSLALEKTLVPGYISLRYCGRSSALLAIEQWEQTVVIEIATLNSVPDQLEVLQLFEQHAVDLGATVHWGQLNHRSRSDVEKVYGAENIGLWRGTLRRLCGKPSVFQTFDNDFSQSHGLEYVGSALPYFRRIRDEFPSGCVPAKGVDWEPDDKKPTKLPKAPPAATALPPGVFGDSDKRPIDPPLHPIFQYPNPDPGPKDPGPFFEQRINDRLAPQFASSKLAQVSLAARGEHLATASSDHLGTKLSTTAWSLVNAERGIDSHVATLSSIPETELVNAVAANFFKK